MKFVDETEIRVRSGHGGRGMVSFRAAKNAPKLGADGGDGGFGGHVYLRGNNQLNTLSGLYYKRMYAAEDGQKGGSNGRTGKNGADVVIEVPFGTVAYDKDTGELVSEVLGDDRVLIAKGGKRGLGNLRYLSPTHQAPEESTEGGEGVEIRLGLELKLIADVGFAGFPNAGKSTLLSALSAARPRIADYPFTTLQPQLGVVDLQDCGDYWDRSFVAADIPGLIAGASEGRGLGHEFLRHLERTKVIAYIIDPFSYDDMEPHQALKTLKSELETFSERLANKRALIVLTKKDLASSDFDWHEVLSPLNSFGYEILIISAVAQKGMKELKLKLWDMIFEERSVIRESENRHHDFNQDKEYKMVQSAALDEELGI